MEEITIENIKEVYFIDEEQEEFLRYLASLPKETKEKILKEFDIEYDKSLMKLVYPELLKALSIDKTAIEKAKRVFHIPSAVENGFHWGKLQGAFMREANRLAVLSLAVLGHEGGVLTVKEDIKTIKELEKLKSEAEKVFNRKGFIASFNAVVMSFSVPWINGPYKRKTIYALFFKNEDGSITVYYRNDWVVRDNTDLKKKYRNLQEFADDIKNIKVERFGFINVYDDIVCGSNY